MAHAPVNLFIEDLRNGDRRTEPAETAQSRGGLVDAVRPDSAAAEAGIVPGARVISANGRILRDVVDYQFYTAEPEVVLRVLEPEGEERDYHFEKWPDDDLGIEFAEATWDGVRICSNTCFFCFLKGLPKGMRRTIYIKDDDYRLSFLHGNFVTLTNLTDADWERLKEQRLSPLNISVHATELDLRRRMLGYADAPDIVEQIRRLGALGIQAHTQLVLCPGVNDGAHLDRTIADLGALYPTVQTVSVVPVGATMQFEERMGRVGKAQDETRACSPAYARAVVRQVNGWQRRLRAEHGVSIVQAADEYYLIANARIPAASWYDGFPQYENGIGMTRMLLDDWRRTRSRLRRDAELSSGQSRPRGGIHITAGCGMQIAPTLARLFAECDALTGARTDVVGIRNRRFGDRINTSGLLTGEDIVATLKEEPELGAIVLLPRTALDYFGKKFLDDSTPHDVETAIGRPVRFASTLSEALDHLRGLASGESDAEPGRAAAQNGRFWA